MLCCAHSHVSHALVVVCFCFQTANLSASFIFEMMLLRVKALWIVILSWISVWQVLILCVKRFLIYLLNQTLGINEHFLVLIFHAILSKLFSLRRLFFSFFLSIFLVVFHMKLYGNPSKYDIKLASGDHKGHTISRQSIKQSFRDFSLNQSGSASDWQTEAAI